MRNILVCVSGLTPQIITESLYCLSVQKKIKIDELFIFTTTRGRDVILGRDKEYNEIRKYPSLKIELEELFKTYKIKKLDFSEKKHIIVAKEESIELPDIRTDEDNILFPNKLCSFLKDKTSDPETILYCSITGGRKSMSVHLSNVLSLFARENDKLLHVLTKAEHEFKGFFPKTKSEKKDLELCEIPFVRLRSLLDNVQKNDLFANYRFDEIVSFAQKQLKILSEQDSFIVDIQRRELKYGTESLTLEAMEFLFYYYFIDMKSRGENKLSIHHLTSSDTSERFTNYLEQYFPHYYVRETQKKSWEKGYSAADFRTKRSNINKKIKILIEDRDIANQFIIDVDKKYADSRYFIRAQTNRFKIIIPK